MSLVTGDGRRVGPKVFADVPSAAEVTSLKRSRGQWFVVSILLLGALLAAGAALFYFTNTPSQIAGQVEELQDEVKRLGEVNVQLDQEKRELQRFEPINALYARSEQLRGEIRDRIAERPGAVVRTRRTIYESQPRWPVLNDTALGQLQEEVTALEDVRRRVYDWVDTTPQAASTPDRL
jgi:ABC-type multidrug transport system fused ATPase/permease subunit